jgi:phenylacetic acid degradation operon negative regulatory protein
MTQPRNGPFSTRSVLASALLGQEPAELPVAQLVRLGRLFGMGENRVRVALTRMVASGECTTDGAGRYRLTGRLLDRHRRQSASRRGKTRRWSGRWTEVVVVATGSSPEVRVERRRALGFARLAELRDGVWLRPDNLDVALPDPVSADVVTFVARVDDDAALCRRLWALDEWAVRALELLAEMAARPPHDAGDLAPGFTLSAAVLRHLQADPLLPVELLPTDWPGGLLRSRYEGWDAAYREVLVAWSAA